MARYELTVFFDADDHVTAEEFVRSVESLHGVHVVRINIAPELAVRETPAGRQIPLATPELERLTQALIALDKVVPDALAVLHPTSRIGPFYEAAAAPLA